ncbi:hypothetical protein ACJIZ3_021276 [Penstemon smallii]|uniref:C2H2-type domain-containing protein n=1 Tax=Penstemon smallii TaxID=265156 RepID=A0ABD3SLT6_9LAMI
MAKNNTFFSFFILLFHLIGCFFSSSHHHHHHRRSHHHNSSSSTARFKKKITSTKKTISSFLNNLFSAPSTKPTPPPPPPSFPSPSSSTRSLYINPHKEEINYTPCHQNIFPCTICGEIFQIPTLLEQHQSTKHAISELIDGENIVRIIFKTGWPETAKTPKIHRILKIHNSPKIIARFEDYREIVKSRASANVALKPSLKDERCIADGNELLRFHCTTFMCELDGTVCNQQYCSVCGIIKNGFSPKMDGISTLPTSWRAHVAVPDDLEEEFRFMNVKRALLVCRVVAGRVGCDPGLVDKEDPGFDSLVGPGEEEDELLVFNPRAVLPCFVIVYTV